VRFEVITQTDFNKLSDVEHPQGIAAAFSIPKPKPLGASGIYVALEDVSDPGNMGTIFRTCSWFGVQDILLSPNCVEPWNPKVLRSSMGAMFHLNIIEDEKFYTTITRMRGEGTDIVAADLDGDDVYGFKPKEKSLLVFSSEANGPSEKLVQLSTRKVTIPKFGKAESLNVAISSAVILSEVIRKARH
jgi:TrmH family RNA methyltransferase